MHQIDRIKGSRRTPLRRRITLLLWLSVFSLGPTCPAEAVDPVAPAAVERIASRGFPDWNVIDQRPFVRHPETIWTLYLEERTSGTVLSEGRETPIRQTRVRVALRNGGADGEVDIGYLQHLSNTVVAALSPGDPRLDEAPTVDPDPNNPWPNPAGLNFVDLQANVDLDDDDENDLVLRYYATIDDPRAQGIVAIAADEFGTPRIMDLSEFIGSVNTEHLHLVDLERPDPRMFDPILEASWLPAKDCRFLAQLGIPGELQCHDCCTFPIYLRRAVKLPEDRLFHPFFDRQRQGGELLDRVRTDLAVVSAGEDQPELTSGEQAALARVASFFYLTGSGIQSRVNLEKALGARVNEYKTQLLLDRIEDYFLRRD